MSQLTEIRGQVTNVRYRKGTFTIAVVDTKDETVSVLGDMLDCMAGREYVFRGEYSYNAKFGKQFRFKEYEESAPEDTDGVIAFLSSGLIKGIGPKKAAAIAAKFGMDTFSILQESPARLAEVSGISLEKALEIGRIYKEHQEFADVTVELQKMGIGVSYAVRLYEMYGADAPEAVREDPFQLVDDIEGIGFKRADEIAKKVGLPPDDDGRVRCGINVLLSYAVGEGHTFLPREELVGRAAEMLEVPRETVDDRLVAMVFEGDLKVDTLQGWEVVYPPAFHTAERYVATKLAALSQEEMRPLGADADSLVDAAQHGIGIVFSEEQRKAVLDCLDKGVLVITGGPGTGKTTIINGILRIFRDNGVKTALAAPTGRAAKRITETTGHEASTLHRLLGYAYDEGTREMVFGKNETDPLDYDAVIVDEASMVDLLLMQGLLKALKLGTRLVLVGDADQLPSVGAGNVLADILRSDYIHAVRLKEIFRQAQESLIIVNAHRIDHGEYPSCNEKGGDFFMMERGSEEDIRRTILELVKDRLPAHYALHDPLQDIQVITPAKKRGLGTIRLNELLQQTLNPPAPGLHEIEAAGRTFREGDKVMQNRNDYLLAWRSADDFSEGEGVFNGDVGYISRIDEEEETVTVVFDDRYVTYTSDILDELEPAFAVTVHKSQGSEFPVVVIPMSWFPPVLATRNLIYTAITRAKEAVVIVGMQRYLNAMVDNNEAAHRYSGLAERLQAMIEPAEEEMVTFPEDMLPQEALYEED